MRNKILLIFALFFLAFPEAKTQSILQNGEIPKDLLITLERTPCYGNCPDYKLTINSKGKVIFNGGYFTKKKGKASGKISEEELKKVISEFETSGFFKLKDAYAKYEDGCTRVYSDDPETEIISIQINGKKKQVSHFFGCEGVEITESIEKLGEKIDEVTNSQRWIEPRKSYEEVKRDILRKYKKTLPKSKAF